MKLIELIKSEFSGFGRWEKILFPLVLLVICALSFYAKDSKIALVSAVCGIGYTIMAGKGRISCYYIGILGTFCYSYIAFLNGFYGNLALYSLYYLPMDVVGIINWRKHLKKETREIKKAVLSNKERFLYGILSVIISCILSVILFYTGDKNPVIDSITTVLSVLGLMLTVKRAMEQWYIWFIVDCMSFIMWLIAYLNGSNCLSTVLMWLVYTILAIYFLFNWRKEINK